MRFLQPGKNNRSDEPFPLLLLLSAMFTFLEGDKVRECGGALHEASLRVGKVLRMRWRTADVELQGDRRRQAVVVRDGHENDLLRLESEELCCAGEPCCEIELARMDR